MKVLRTNQNSEEWLEYRKGKSGGSEFKDLYINGLPLKTKLIEKIEADGQKLTPEDKRSSAADLAAMLAPREIAEIKIEGEPKKKYYEIIAERIARPVTPNDYIDKLNGQPFSMMARGHILEPEAAEAFTKKTKLKLYGNVVWIRDDDENIYISPDRIVEKKGETPETATEAVEIKCLSSPEIIKAFLTNSYPAEYEPQIIKYFVVNENLKKLYFVLYTDLIPELELQIFTIERGQIEDRVDEAKAFEDAIMKRIEADINKIESINF